MPDDPAALWTEGPRVEPVIAWWTGWHGPRTPVRDDLIVEVERAGLRNGLPASELVHGIANPDTCAWLAQSVPGIPDEGVVVSVARTLPWLAYHLPANDPVRAALPAVEARVRRRLADPDLAIPVGFVEDDRIDRFAAALGETAVHTADSVRIGPVVLSHGEYWYPARVRPALLTGPDDPLLRVLAAQLLSCEETVLAGIRALLGDQIATMVAMAEPTDATHLQDPSRSCPALVAEVAAALGTGPDAAALYLQLLALPDPTDRNVAAWTGWPPTRLKAARGQLAGTDLVVEAKRARAGRTLFLPGGWLALKAPYLPLERWKVPLVVGGEDGFAELGILVPIAPLPALFELAWARVRDGDPPRFDALVTADGRR